MVEDKTKTGDQTDKARAYLKTVFKPEFHNYIDNKLAGDLACKVADKLKAEQIE